MIHFLLGGCLGMAIVVWVHTCMLRERFKCLESFTLKRLAEIEARMDMIEAEQREVAEHYWEQTK